MNEFEKFLQERGYIKLELGSYYRWISVKWHRMFIRNGLVKLNFYNQYSPTKEKLLEFSKMSNLYDRVQHDRDYPKSMPQVTKEEKEQIKRIIW